MLKRLLLDSCQVDCFLKYDPTFLWPFFKGVKKVNNANIVRVFYNQVLTQHLSSKDLAKDPQDNSGSQ